MRAVIIALLLVSFGLAACGNAGTAAPPAQPSPTLDPALALPTQPPAAPADPIRPEPTAAPPMTPVPPSPTVTPPPSPPAPPTASPAPMPDRPTPFPSPIQANVPPPVNAQPLQPPFGAFIDARIERAKQDLAQRLGVAVDAIAVAEVELVTWPDGALGCPAPGMVYPQVLIDGVRVHLRVNEQIFAYHGDDRNPLFLCDPQQGPRVRQP